jgi:hypothetical protein
MMRTAEVPHASQRAERHPCHADLPALATERSPSRPGPSLQREWFVAEGILWSILRWIKPRPVVRVASGPTLRLLPSRQ